MPLELKKVPFKKNTLKNTTKKKYETEKINHKIVCNATKKQKLV